MPHFDNADLRIHDGHTLTAEFVAAVNPGEKSGKYSLNMYRWLRCKRNRYALNAYALQWHGNTFNPSETFNLGDVVLGYKDDGWIIATTLGTVLTGCKGFTNGGGAYPPALCVKAIEIPHFWENYVKHGRCVWDRKHHGFMADAENRFEEISDHTRRCLWCGEIQNAETRNVFTQTVVWAPHHQQA